MHPKYPSLLLSKLSSQNQEQIRGLLTPDESFRYLEYSSTELESNGKTWKIFGSPVSGALFESRFLMFQRELRGLEGLSITNVASKQTVSRDQ
jgi:hypothetical protein